MKKTVALIILAAAVLATPGCGGEEEVTETPDPVVHTQQNNEVPAEVDISEEMARRIEEEAARDRQIEEDQELILQIGAERELTIDDCNKLKDPELRDGCINLVELDSGSN